MTTLTTTDEIQNRIQQATDYLKKQVSASPDFALILGTGLGELADKAKAHALKCEMPLPNLTTVLLICFGCTCNASLAPHRG